MLVYIVVIAVAGLIWFFAEREQMPVPVLLGGAALLAGFVGIYVAKRYHNADTELLGGRVVVKDYDMSSCSHSYSCNCKTTDKSRSCDTCYHHTFDYEYYVKVSGGLYHSASCGDCSSPRWWDVTNVGDPVVIPHSYQNYLLADPNSLLIPTRPQGVSGTDIPRDRLVATTHQIHGLPVIGDGVNVPAGMLDQLRVWNADHGAQKQAHINVVLTSNPDPQYADLLAHEWMLGPKNSVIFVIGVDPQVSQIRWGRLVTFSEDTELRRWVRDEISSIPVENLIDTLGDQVMKLHQRTPMATLEYLQKMTPVGILPTLLIAMGQVGIAFILLVVLSKNHSRYY